MRLWNDALQWHDRCWWSGPPIASRRWAQALERAKAAPAPRINLLSFTAFVREVPQIHHGRQQPYYFIVEPPRRTFDYLSLEIDTEPVMVDRRAGLIGYRWVP